MIKNTIKYTKYKMNIILMIICLGTISFLLLSCLIILGVKLYESDIMSFFNNNRNMIVPVRNVIVPIGNVKPKKEIEMILIKKYVVVQSPEQQFSIGIEV